MIGVCPTGGHGLWSTRECDVVITRLEITYIDENTLLASTFGELRAHYDPTTWDAAEHGLIYTDAVWIRNFRALLMEHGFSEEAVKAVDYSEAGMQGKHFVSMDIHHAFIRECDPLYNFTINKQKSLTIHIDISH